MERECKGQFTERLTHLSRAAQPQRSWALGTVAVAGVETEDRAWMWGCR